MSFCLSMCERWDMTAPVFSSLSARVMGARDSSVAVLTDRPAGSGANSCSGGTRHT